MNLPPKNLNFVGRLTWKNEVFFDFFWFPPDFWTKTHIKMDSPLGGYQLKYGLLYIYHAGIFIQWRASRPSNCGLQESSSACLPHFQRWFFILLNKAIIGMISDSTPIHTHFKSDSRLNFFKMTYC